MKIQDPVAASDTPVFSIRYSPLFSSCIHVSWYFWICSGYFFIFRRSFGFACAIFLAVGNLYLVVFCTLWHCVLWYFVMCGVLHFVGLRITYCGLLCFMVLLYYVFCGILCILGYFVPKLWYFVFGHCLRVIIFIRYFRRLALFVNALERPRATLLCARFHQIPGGAHLHPNLSAFSQFSPLLVRKN